MQRLQLCWHGVMPATNPLRMLSGSLFSLFMPAAHFAGGIFGNGEMLPLAAECVIAAQNAVFGRQAEQDFQGFGRLGGADDAYQRGEYAEQGADAVVVLLAVEQAGIAGLAGQQTVSPEMNSAGQSIPPEHSAILDSLTQRERDVLRYVAGGISNKMIARRMFLSENTVKAHMQNIFRKLNIDNRVRAAVYARELGLDKEEE